MANPQEEKSGCGGLIAVGVILALVGALSESRKETKPISLPKLPSVEVPRIDLQGEGPSLSGGPAASQRVTGTGAAGLSRIQFENRSGEPALVRLVGPSRGEVHVPNGAASAIKRLAPGRYRILVRYGTEGRYRYAEGDPFQIEETAWSYSDVRITLHPVVGGNYRTRPARAADFEAAAPPASNPQ